jgi:hypothetical protein
MATTATFRNATAAPGRESRTYDCKPRALAPSIFDRVRSGAENASAILEQAAAEAEEGLREGLSELVPEFLINLKRTSDLVSLGDSPNIMAFFYIWRHAREQYATEDKRLAHTFLGHWLVPPPNKLLHIRRLLQLSNIAYIDSPHELEERIRADPETRGLRVVHAQMESNATDAGCIVPAHFLVVDDGDENGAGSRVVLSVSGTKDALDVVSDVCLHSAPFRWRSRLWHAATRTSDAKAHAGILRASRELLALHGDALRRYSAEGRRIVLTGHSLGGGVAALVAVQLKETIEDVECVAFAPPPCATLRAAELCDGFVVATKQCE